MIRVATWAGFARDLLSPKGSRGSRRRRSCYSSSVRGAALGSRATIKGARTGQFMRVMFWLSRVYAPLWWDSNYASNDPRLRHPALPAVFTCQSHEYRKRTKHTVEFSSCQHNRKKRFRRVSGCAHSDICAVDTGSRGVALRNSKQFPRWNAASSSTGLKPAGYAHTLTLHRPEQH